MANKKTQKEIQFDSTVCSFQGGGALGAFQAGVIIALQEAGYFPEWFVGTSIGAINAAICAGNPPELRKEKLLNFWDRIATHNHMDNYPLPNDVLLNKWLNLTSSQSTLVYGQPDFFTPRFPPPDFSLHDDPTQLSYYDTSPLKATLEELVDFNLLNTGTTRLSVGAVEITTGEMVYFDSNSSIITAEHIMASGALPPGFPAVEVNDKLYWDGGISSNTPVSYVLKDKGAKKRLCFMVHLFDSYGLKPKNLDEVNKRMKDIEFSSRFQWVLALHKEIHSLRHQIHHLSNTLSKEHLENPIIRECAESAREYQIALVRFLHEADETELSTKDYDFSARSIQKNIDAGYHYTAKACQLKPWNRPISKTRGIELYEMTHFETQKES